jgi:O-acetyl-ADP-ribose deacetylase (regulator of RNase III)
MSNIQLVSGNIFNSDKQTITNAVNTVGVMGNGLAAQFKKKYPEYFNQYKIECFDKTLAIGQLTVYQLNENKQILNFPTKEHWKNTSTLMYIESGLQYLAENYYNMNITSLALPPLGCGLGGLQWEDVYTMMLDYLTPLEIEIDIYKPY